MRITDERAAEIDELDPTTEDILMMVEEEKQASVRNDAREETGSEKDGNEYYISDSMKLYLKEIGRIPLLTAEEEIRLGRKISKGGKEAREARNELVQANLRLVVFYAKKYLGRGLELSDLNALGIEGLLKAAEKYNYSLGFRFSTYASWWINQAIYRGIANESGFVKIPVHMYEIVYKVRKAQKELKQEYGEEPTAGEIAEYVKLPEKTVMTALSAAYNIVSLDKMVGEDGDASLEDLLPDENAEDPCEAAMNNSLKDAVQKVFSRLTPKEVLVLSLRYGIGTGRPMTLEEVAKHPEFGVTRERIRQIEEKALRKIRRNPGLMNLLRDFAA